MRLELMKEEKSTELFSTAKSTLQCRGGLGSSFPATPFWKIPATHQIGSSELGVLCHWLAVYLRALYG